MSCNAGSKYSSLTVVMTLMLLLAAAIPLLAEAVVAPSGEEAGLSVSVMQSAEKPFGDTDAGADLPGLVSAGMPLLAALRECYRPECAGNHLPATAVYGVTRAPPRP